MLDNKQQPYLPVFLTSRLYVDFSDPSKRAENFAHLVRSIYDKGTRVRPELGPLPKDILDDKANDYPLGQAALKVKGDIESPRLLASVYQNSFLGLMEESVKRCVVSEETADGEIYDKVIEKISDFDDIEQLFQECLQLYVQSDEADGAYFADYFNHLIEYVRSTLNEEDQRKDPIRFLIQEQFLMVVGEMIRQRKWNLIHYLVLAKYKIGNGMKVNFGWLRSAPMSIYNYNDEHTRNYNIIGTMIKDRNKKISNQLWCADMLLFYLWKLQHRDDENAMGMWYPPIQTSTSSTQLPDFSLLENLNISENMESFLLMSDMTEEELKLTKIYNTYTSLEDLTGVPAIKQFQKNSYY